MAASPQICRRPVLGELDANANANLDLGVAKTATKSDLPLQHHHHQIGIAIAEDAAEDLNVDIAHANQLLLSVNATRPGAAILAEDELDLNRATNLEPLVAETNSSEISILWSAVATHRNNQLISRPTPPSLPTSSSFSDYFFENHRPEAQSYYVHYDYDHDHYESELRFTNAAGDSLRYENQPRA